MASAVVERMGAIGFNRTTESLFAEEELEESPDEDDGEILETSRVVSGFKDLRELVPELTTTGGWLVISQEDNSLSVRIKRDDGIKVTKTFDFTDLN